MRQCLFHLFRSVYAAHRILYNHFLLVRVGKDIGERAVMVSDRFRREWLALRRSVICLQIDKVLLDLNGADFLQDAALKVVSDNLYNVFVERNACGLAVAAPNV